MAVVSSIRESLLAIACLSLPSRKTMERLREGFSLSSGPDIYLAFYGFPSLRFCGFLITAANDVNDLIAFCPISGGLEMAGALWRQELHRQFTTALHVTQSPAATIDIDVIDLRRRPGSPRERPRWLFGLACVPLTRPWDGRICQVSPFCPSLFRSLARRPEAADWLRTQQVAELGTVAHQTAQSAKQPHLTPRQRSVLLELRAGRSEKEVAASLNISQHTVHGYVKQIYKSFGVSTRGELMASFLR